MIVVSKSYPQTYDQNTRIGHLIRQGGFADMMKYLEVGNVLDCLGGPNIITKILTREGRRSEVDM